MSDVRNWVDAGHELDVLGLGLALLHQKDDKGGGQRRRPEQDGESKVEALKVRVLVANLLV
jgi:hypothetical protein